MTGTVVGLVLAAGAGRRMGGPKALRRTASGELLLVRAVGALDEGGCARVVVTLARPLPGPVRAELTGRGLHPTEVEVADADRGLAASLSAGLRSAVAAEPGAAAVAITLVDLPDVSPAVVARLLGASGEVRPDVLRRAVYDGRPGHPVLLGRDHLAPFVASLDGDRGGQAYLERRRCSVVECADLASGTDVDTPAELTAAP